MPFDKNVPITQLIETAIEWLTNDVNPANLVFLYFWQPDNLGHIYGPNSQIVIDELEKVTN